MAIRYAKYLFSLKFVGFPTLCTTFWCKICATSILPCSLDCLRFRSLAIIARDPRPPPERSAAAVTFWLRGTWVCPTASQ